MSIVGFLGRFNNLYSCPVKPKLDMNCEDMISFDRLRQPCRFKMNKIFPEEDSL
jgi:hypothetical protein